MGTAGRTAPATQEISVELKTYDLNYTLVKLPFPQPLTATKPFPVFPYTYLHSPRWGAGADHRASGPGESGVGRGVPGSGLGGVQHGQEHELLRGGWGGDRLGNNNWLLRNIA